MYQKHPAISSSLVVLLFFMHVKTNLKIHAIDIIYFVLILMLEDVNVSTSFTHLL
jgi:hypothetical protein